MDVVFRHRGREITTLDAEFMRRLIAEHPKASRKELSRLVCRAWDWVQPNGALRDMVCRGLMLSMHRAGLIELPPPRRKSPNNIIRRRKPQPMLVDKSPLEARLTDLGPLEFCQVRRTGDEPLFDYLVSEHHYLGYTRPVGEHLKYLVFARNRPVACMAWSSAPLRLGPRDQFIGWSPEARKRNLRLIAYNPRYLILPWVRVPHLASHLLSHVARILCAEWERFYGHPVHYLETFVDSERYRGTCYLAANWISVGKTKGYGKDTRTHQRVVTIKEVLGYPLTKHFRELLGRLD